MCAMYLLLRPACLFPTCLTVSRVPMRGRWPVRARSLVSCLLARNTEHYRSASSEDQTPPLCGRVLGSYRTAFENPKRSGSHVHLLKRKKHVKIGNKRTRLSLGGTTCLTLLVYDRPHSFYACFAVSRIAIQIICYIIRDF